MDDSRAAQAQVQEDAEEAIECLGNIINDAPFRGEERDGAWQAFLENAKVIRAALRAPSPVAWQEITNPDRGLFLVTNNINAMNAHGYMSHVWVVNAIHVGHTPADGKFWCIDPWDNRVFGLTHYQPILPPAISPSPEHKR